MARYHCDRVSERLQAVEGVQVRNVTQSSWTFSQGSARLNLRVMPGCCGILLAYQLSGKERDLFRLLKHVIRAAQHAEFGMVLMSLRSDSRLRALLPAEWVSAPFKNPRTKKAVEVLSLIVPEKPAKGKKQYQVHEDA